jgi:hypothetical protein
MSNEKFTGRDAELMRLGHEAVTAPLPGRSLVEQELVAALRGVTEKLRVCLATEKRPTLAMWPKSGVEYAGVDPAGCPEIQRAEAAIAMAGAV